MRLILSIELLPQTERQHVFIHLLLRLREVCDLFPYFDVLVGALRVSLCIVCHELQVLLTSILFEAREDTHWNVVRDVLKDLLPPIDCALEFEDVPHALLDCLFAHRDGSPERLERSLVSVQVIHVVFVRSHLFLCLRDYLLDHFDAVDRFLQPFEVVNLSLDPRDDVRVGVAQILGQILHRLLVIFVLRVRDYALLLVTTGVEVNASQLILCQLVEERLCNRVKVDS